MDGGWTWLWALRAGDSDLIAAALRVVERLPTSQPVDRAVLAAEVFDGRPHSLDADCPLEHLTCAMLAGSQGMADGEQPRAVWAGCGVDVDPTSSAVLTLGLAPLGQRPIEVALRAVRGCHFVLTLGQLSPASMCWPACDVFVCENPSVLRAAERALGARCPPLVCAAGWPTDAVRLLMDQLTASGATLRYHGDFDATGVAIFRRLESELGVLPWRFDAAAYEAALAALASRELPILAAGPPGDVGTLETALSAHRREIPEELLISEMLGDLRSAGADATSSTRSRRAIQHVTTQNPEPETREVS